MLPSQRRGPRVPVFDQDILYGVIDVGNTPIGTLPPTITLTGSVSATTLDGAHGIAVVGDYAYVVAYNADRLTVVDISTPASPSVAGSVQHSTNLNGAQSVVVVGDYAYVTAFLSDRLTVVDISTPASPSIVGSVTHANLNGAFGVAVNGNTAYVTSYNDSLLAVVDVTTPASPTYAGATATTNPELTNAAGIAYTSADRVVISAYSNGRVTAAHIPTPATPSVEGSDTTESGIGSRRIAVDGDYAYTAGYANDYVAVTDISDVDNPAFVASVTDGTALDQRFSVAKTGSTVLTGGFGAQPITAVDVSTPGSPTVVVSETIVGLQSTRDIAISGGYAYIADFDGDQVVVLALANF